MKKLTIFNLCLVIILLSILVYYKFFNVNEDVLYDITNGQQIVELSNDSDIYKKLKNNIIQTNYSDKAYALEYIDMCKEMFKIEKVNSKEFAIFSGVDKLANYMKINKIEDPMKCLKSKYATLDGLKKECIFNNDNGLHNPYLAGYVNGTVTDKEISDNLLTLSEFYLQIQPLNSLLLLAVYDKINGKFINEEYCDITLVEKYDTLIRPSDYIHIDNNGILISTGSVANSGSSTNSGGNK